MTIHDLKLDDNYFNDVEKGKKKFEIRKNDRGFQVGDVLKLHRVFIDSTGCLFYGRKTQYSSGNVIEAVSEDRADTLKVKVVCVLSNLEVNEGIDFMNYNPKVSLFEDEALPFLKAGWRNDWDYNYFLSVLQEYFQVEHLPEDYVVLGVEMMEF